jgi:uncharacterized membrane protein
MYLALKLVHVLAVVLFVGNITVGIFWKSYADLTKDPRIIVYTMRGILRADRWFTIPGIIVLVIAGIGAAQVGHLPILGTGWILWAIILLVISGIAFGPLTRVQRQIAALDDQAGSFDWNRYEALSRLWALWGMFALVTPLLAVAFMVLKPALPAFHM